MAIGTITSSKVENLPPDVLGDIIIEVPNRTPHVFSAAEFTTLTTPIYSDPEGNTMNAVKITSISYTGILTNAGNIVSVGDIISEAVMGSNLFVYTPFPTDAALPNESFTFTARDTGSNTFCVPPVEGTVTLNCLAKGGFTPIIVEQGDTGSLACKSPINIVIYLPDGSTWNGPALPIADVMWLDAAGTIAPSAGFYLYQGDIREWNGTAFVGLPTDCFSVPNDPNLIQTSVWYDISDTAGVCAGTVLATTVWLDQQALEDATVIYAEATGTTFADSGIYRHRAFVPPTSYTVTWNGTNTINNLTLCP
jgi:hypothetical protein